MTEGIHFSKDLEAAVLGICMLEKTAFGRTYGLVEEQTFYSDTNKLVYRCLSEMYTQNIPIDLLTVWQRLAEQSPKINGQKIDWYLVSLTNQVVTSAHVEYHCHLLKNMWRRRELERLTRSGIDGFEDTRKQINELSEQLNEIRGSEFKRDWYDMSELMYDLMMRQRDIAAGENQFVTTGLRAVDKLNGGYSAGQLIIIGARPSVGKSAFMGKMAIAMARQGKKVGIISLEMNNTDIAARLASLETEIDFPTIYRNLFADENEHKRFYDIISKNTINLPIWISDKTGVDVNEIRAKAMKLMHKQGCDCLMIDYLQLVDSVRTGNRNINREQEISKISRGFKLMAMELNIPVVVPCQLNRAVTGRSGKDRYPRLSDLRESGAIEQDADIVLMLHRDWQVGIEADPVTGKSTRFEADLLGLKWRNGATFHLKLDFDPPKMKFSEPSASTGWIPVKSELFSDSKDDQS